MSILVKGMEMPKEGTVIAIYKLNGQFFVSVHSTELCPLIPVPTPHGRLIDADVLLEHLGDMEYKGAVKRVLMQAPTIIEAEKGENEYIG